MRIRTTLLAACAAALIAPAASQAAALGMDGNTLVYNGQGGQGLWMSVSTQEDWNSGIKYLHFSDSGAQVSINTNLCHDNQFGGIDCDLNANRPLRIEGSSAKDDIQISQGVDRIPDSMAVTINGGAGNDKLQDAWGAYTGRTLNGGPGDDEIHGYEGNDTLDGGDGADNLDGGSGDDRVLGGTGNDEVDGDGYDEVGSDYIDGGAGYDYVDGWNDPEILDKNPSVDITLDGIANDGRPGENDNVVGVEDFQMYTVGRIVGTDAREKIVIYNPANSGPSTLIGNGGDDELAGQDFNDTVDGGAGNDQVEGGLGNDTVVGGPGQDIIYGDATASRCTWYSCKVPFGNDVIQARDGEADSIDCGIGEDTAYVDAIDTVANCEKVIGAGSNGNGPGGGGSNNGGGGAKVTITIAKAKLAAMAAKGLKIKVACTAACSAKGTITADKATGRKLGTRKLAKGKGKAASAGTATVKLKASKKVARKLRRLKTAKGTVKITVTQGGKTSAFTRKVTLKR
jgi:RTX calcium-binding nonapeptide repeat (4 copies)